MKQRLESPVSSYALRPRITYFMTEKAIAIDIGGTNTCFALVDKEGNILDKKSVPTRGHKDLDEYLRLLFADIHAMIGKDTGISGIGIGAPCANYETGEIEAATDLPWPSPIPLRQIFEKEFGVPAFVSNDAKTAAMGEMLFGAAKGLDNFIMITLGTGVGSGIVCDGKILSGRSGFAGELGHVTVSYDRRRPCKCGRHDCLQNYCSAGGIAETAISLLRKTKEESLLRAYKEEDLTPKLIYECAAKGDALSLRVYEETGEILGRACANFAAFSSPEAFIFFGGVSKALRLMEPSLRRSLEENILFLYKGKIRILQSGLEETDAALLGASALVFNALQIT